MEKTSPTLRIPKAQLRDWACFLRQSAALDLALGLTFAFVFTSAAADLRSAARPGAAEPGTNATPAETVGSTQPASGLAGSRARPRTLSVARDYSSGLASKPAPDPLAAGDSALADAVQHRWFRLLERAPLLPLRGAVVVRFTLREDGSVTNLTVLSSEVSEFLTQLCQAAVLSPAPYARWSSDVRLAIGADQRPVTITFRYLEGESGPPRWMVRQPRAHLWCELRYEPEAISHYALGPPPSECCAPTMCCGPVTPWFNQYDDGSFSARRAQKQMFDQFRHNDFSRLPPSNFGPRR